MKTKERVGRGIAALVLAGLYALAVQALMDWLGPWRFLAVTAGVLAAVWYLVDTTPHTVRYVAAPPRQADDGQRLTVGDILLIARDGKERFRPSSIDQTAPIFYTLARQKNKEELQCRERVTPEAHRALVRSGRGRTADGRAGLQLAGTPAAGSKCRDLSTVPRKKMSAQS